MVDLTPKEEEAKKRVCLPLDGINTLEEMEQLIQSLASYVGVFKIGKGTFTRFGPEAITLVHKYGGKVFLDLKYHDIPNTVEDAAYAATKLGVYMFNVHASGGIKMMKAAKEGVRKAIVQGYYDVEFATPKVIAVTVLTSIDSKILQSEVLGTERNLIGHVEMLAKNVKKAGLDGIVCSAADLKRLKNRDKKDKEFPENFMYVTPGIKGPNGAVGADQKRVFTPGNAVQDGSSLLVVGRAITDPRTMEEKEQNLKVTVEMQQNAAYAVLQDMAKNL
ncbi:MAG: orotidine-5'-phosphate decarboxylase [Patescibacteria group bacterium]|nr:orotidine-5'-phosphate decarboxylase [Patescibacteria group bacterium]